ncbi:hypothetical protein BC835DRAFT_1355374, partial [Cytidiella melzeri]
MRFSTSLIWFTAVGMFLTMSVSAAPHSSTEASSSNSLVQQTEDTADIRSSHLLHKRRYDEQALPRLEEPRPEVVEESIRFLTLLPDNTYSTMWHSVLSSNTRLSGNTANLLVTGAEEHMRNVIAYLLAKFGTGTVIRNKILRGEVVDVRTRDPLWADYIDGLNKNKNKPWWHL